MNFLTHLFLFSAVFIVIEGNYAIIGPRAVNRKENLNVFVVTNIDVEEIELDKVEKMVLTLNGEKSGEIDEKEIELNFNYEKVTFDLQNHEYLENFNLIAIVESRNFTQSFKITQITKIPRAIIQTDKSNYNPSETVKLRILFLDGESKSYQPADDDVFNINVQDEFSNEIYKQEKIKFGEFPGVFEGSFEIDENAVLGQIKIAVGMIRSDNGKKENMMIGEKKLEIDEKTRDDFEILIETNFATDFAEKKLNLKISAKYKFGLFVKGKALIKTKIYQQNNPDKSWKGEQKVVETSNETEVEFDLINDLKISNTLNSLLVVEFDVEFTEVFTGKKKYLNHSTLICIENCFEINFVQENTQIKPGFVNNFEITVFQMQTMKLVEGSSPEMEVEVKYYTKVSECAKEKIVAADSLTSLLTDGKIELKLHVPIKTSKIKIYLKYQNVKKEIELKIDDFNVDEVMILTLVTENPEANDQVMNLESSSELETFYLFVSQSSQILHETSYHGNYENKTDVEFTTSSDMEVVDATVLYISEKTGGIVKDQLLIDFKKEPGNFLNISIYPEKLSPGQECTITIHTIPDAIVSLSAIEASFTNSLDTGIQDLDNKNRPESNGASNNLFFMSIASKSEEEICTTNRKKRSAEIDEDDEIEKLSNKDDDHPTSSSLEPWIFESFKSDKSGEIVLKKTVPDFITSWQISATSSHPEAALVTLELPKIDVTKDLFLKVDFPVSTRIQEVVKVKIIIFNYISTASETNQIKVEVSGNDEENEFEFLEKDFESVFIPIEERKIIKTVSVKSNSQASVFVHVRPMKSGTLQFKFNVSFDSDHKYELVKYLKVLPDIATTFNTHNLFVDLRKEKEFSYGIGLSIPDDALLKSIKIEGSIGNLIDPLVEDAKSMLTGKAEKTSTEKTKLLRSIQSLLSVGYLKMSNISTNLTGIDLFLNQTYKSIIERKTADGSFNFKGHGPLESVWLTSLVVKSLGKHRSLFPESKNIIKSALDFLKKRQYSYNSVDSTGRNISGSFVDFGEDVKIDVPFTAFVLTAFLENPEIAKDYKETIDRALYFINRYNFLLSNNYDLALCSYVSALAEHESAKLYIESMTREAITESDKKYWSFNINGSKKNNSQTGEEIELACYAFLAFAEAGEVTDLQRIMMWIMPQLKNNLDILKDSFVIRQFLIKVAETFKTPELKIDFKVSSGENEFSFQVDDKNLNHNLKLPGNSRVIHFFAKGTGFVNFEIVYSFSKYVEEFSNPFSLDVSPELIDDGKILRLTICTQLNSNENDEEFDENYMRHESPVMEVNLPKGFIYNFDSSVFLRKLGVKKVEVYNDKSTILLQFQKVTKMKICPEIYAFQERQEIETERSVIRLYERQDKRAVKYYRVTQN